MVAKKWRLKFLSKIEDVTHVSQPSADQHADRDVKRGLPVLRVEV